MIQSKGGFVVVKVLHLSPLRPQLPITHNYHCEVLLDIKGDDGKQLASTTAQSTSVIQASYYPTWHEVLEMYVLSTYRCCVISSFFHYPLLLYH